MGKTGNQALGIFFAHSDAWDELRGRIILGSVALDQHSLTTAMDNVLTDKLKLHAGDETEHSGTGSQD